MLLAIALASVILGAATAPGPAVSAQADSAATTPQDATVAQAVRLIQMRRFDEARQLLQPLAEEIPDWPAPYYYIGTIYFEEKRWESGLRSFARVLELAPGFHKARLLGGWCQIYLGRMEQARVSVEAYLRAVPDSADATFALGLIDLDEDDIDSARIHLEKAISMTHDLDRPEREAVIRLRYADLLVRTGEVELAKLELGRAIELDPSNAKIYFKLSRVLQRLGDAKGARLAREKDPAVLDRLVVEGNSP